jgi:Pyruvate/2-oxoacid:ferredoxin oxidoreductase delta subunit
LSSALRVWRYCSDCFFCWCFCPSEQRTRLSN